MARTVFKAAEREPVEVQIGDEVVDLSRLTMRTLIAVTQLVGDDPDSLDTTDFEKIVEAVAALCTPSNPKVTAEYLMGRDAFEEVVPFIKFAMGIIKDRAAGMGDLKNPNPSSTSSPE